MHSKGKLVTYTESVWVMKQRIWMARSAMECPCVVTTAFYSQAQWCLCAAEPSWPFQENSILPAPDKNHIVIIFKFVFQWKWNAKITITSEIVTRMAISVKKQSQYDLFFLHIVQPWITGPPLYIETDIQNSPYTYCQITISRYTLCWLTVQPFSTIWFKMIEQWCCYLLYKCVMTGNASITCVNKPLLGFDLLYIVNPCI